MSERDLLFSIIGHLLIGCLLIFVAPISAGLWEQNHLMPLIIPVSMVDRLPGSPPPSQRKTPVIQIPEPAPEEIPVISPPEEELTEKPAADSVETETEEPAPDTSAMLAAAETDTLDKTGEMSHTIFDGQQAAADDIFGEYIPAAGYGATDPYFQSLFMSIQRAFRNPVPGYKPVRCVITFTIMSDGTIKDVKLETTSGIPRFDRAAIRAIERIEWGRSFPAKFDDFEGYHIRMPFEFIPQ